MVGADASGLEARNLGHYMAAFDGGAYAKVLLEGDVHSVNRDALGLPSTTNAIAKHTRGGSKNWFYAFMYGGGDEKLGKMLAMLRNPETGEPYIKPPKGGWTKDSYRKLGKQLKAKFLKNTPALGKLVEKCKKAFKEKGWLRMPDGRRTYIRSDHSSLNSLLQAAGAIICKKWIVNFSRRLREEFGEPGWGGMWVPLLWVHDEVQLAVRPEIADRVCVILVEEIRKLTDVYGWRVALDGEAKIGANWKETH
jgi:DNA polymerase I-like protein with 3'-5' exonuclease and polymerase domains